MKHSRDFVKCLESSKIGRCGASDMPLLSMSIDMFRSTEFCNTAGVRFKIAPYVVKFGLDSTLI